MKNKLPTFKVFKYENDEIRVTDRNGESWFVAREACKPLGLINVSQVVSRLDEDERDDIIINDAAGRPNKTTIINESGLYSLILTSRKPEAKKFKKWVTSEVLPSIRKTGTYSIDNRAKSKQVRNELTALCKTRGFHKRHHYINLTEKINGSIFQAPTTEKVRQALGFPSKSNLRDELWKSGKLAELGAITVTEGLTTEKVTATNAYGPIKIADMAYDIGKEMSKAIAHIRKSYLPR